MRGAPGTIASVCAPEADPAPEPEEFPWERLRAEHAKAIRAALAERYAYSTVNKALSALRGVLREAWELGLMETEHYHRAAAVRAVKGRRARRAPRQGRPRPRGQRRRVRNDGASGREGGGGGVVVSD